MSFLFHAVFSSQSKDSEYTYDVLGRRVKKITNVNGETPIVTKYFYDGADCIADYSGSDGLLCRYLTPFLDENLMLTTGGVNYWYFHDGLGSVRNILDSLSNIKNSYDYYSFGESLNWSETITNRYTYTGREWDSESGQYYYRARYYVSNVGRFLSHDPIESSNLYVYVRNSPVDYIDPLGTDKKKLDYVTSDFGFLDRLFMGFPERFSTAEELVEKIKNALCQFLCGKTIMNHRF